MTIGQLQAGVATGILRAAKRRLAQDDRLSLPLTQNAGMSS
jgi:hypothetical protein